MINDYPDTKSWTNAQKDQWLSEYSPLIWKSVQKYLYLFDRTPSIDLNDLYQIASMAVLTAFESYEPDRDVKFTTYAMVCMKRGIGMSARRERAMKRYSNVTSLDDENITDILQHDVLKDKNMSPEDQYVYQERLQNIYEYLEKEVGENAPILYTVLCNDITQCSAAQLINCSQSRLSQIVRKIRKEVAAKFQDN